VKPTTLLILFFAAVVGLGATAAARSAGLFNPPPPALTPAPPPPPEVRVVVAARNIFQDTALDRAAVVTRPLRPDELKDYEAHKDQYLTAPESVGQRVAARPIEADRPVTRADLKPLARPDPVHARLLPNKRAVVLGVPRERSAGGLIQVGEWVDIVFTTTYSAPGGPSGTRSLVVAPAARVVVKRDNLLPVPAALPKDGVPIRFTLEVDPREAALIEYARTKGSFALVPRPEADQSRLESRRLSVSVTDLDPGDEAAADVAFGDEELMKRLGLTPPPAPAAVEVIVGKDRKTVVFPAPGGAPGSYTFGPPAQDKQPDDGKKPDAGRMVKR